MAVLILQSCQCLCFSSLLRVNVEVQKARLGNLVMGVEISGGGVGLKRKIDAICRGSPICEGDVVQVHHAWRGVSHNLHISNRPYAAKGCCTAF